MSARALSRFDISRPPATKWTLIPILVVHWLGLLFIFPVALYRIVDCRLRPPELERENFFVETISFSPCCLHWRGGYTTAARRRENGTPSGADTEPASRFVFLIFFRFVVGLHELQPVVKCHCKESRPLYPIFFFFFCVFFLLSAGFVGATIKIIECVVLQPCFGTWITRSVSYRSPPRQPVGEVRLVRSPRSILDGSNSPFDVLYITGLCFFFRKGRKKKRDATRPAAHEPCPGLECIISMFDDYVLGWTGCRWLRRHNPLSLEKDSSERRKFFPTIEEKKNALQWLLMAISRQRN